MGTYDIPTQMYQGFKMESDGRPLPRDITLLMSLVVYATVVSVANLAPVSWTLNFLCGNYH